MGEPVARRFPSVRILVAADDPLLRALMRDVIAEEAG